MVLILAVSLALAYFGINITGFVVFLGALGLALSLAGRDILLQSGSCPSQFSKPDTDY